MEIASFNVNSINARLPNVLAWLDEARPDIACLQEIKTQDESFPALEFEARGYAVLTHGQKSYNGVAILSKLPFEDTRIGLPGAPDDVQARYAEALIMGKTGPVRVASIYLPNGNPVFDGDLGNGEFSEKYLYKLRWMARLREHALGLLRYEEPLILAGDYNVIELPTDTHDAALWEGDALYRAETHAAFNALKWIGLTSAYDQCDGRPHEYTFWDYQAGAWQKNHGIRIDHLLCSAQAADKLRGVRIDKHVRAGEKPSDHVPIIGQFDL